MLPPCDAKISTNFCGSLVVQIQQKNYIFKIKNSKQTLFHPLPLLNKNKKECLLFQMQKAEKGTASGLAYGFGACIDLFQCNFLVAYLNQMIKEPQKQF